MLLSRDLLGKEPQEKLEIKLCPDGSGQLYVPGLTEFRVQSVEDINKVRGAGGWHRVIVQPPLRRASGHASVCLWGHSNTRRELEALPGSL